MGSHLFGDARCHIGIWRDFKGPYSSRPVLVQERVRSKGNKAEQIIRVEASLGNCFSGEREKKSHCLWGGNAPASMASGFGGTPVN